MPHHNEKKIKILGIDPGTRRVGYGVIEKGREYLHLVEANLIPIKSSDHSGALHEIKKGVDALILKHRPKILAIEKLYFSKNQKTAFAVTEARGVILLSAFEHGVLIEEYTPNEIKSRLTGYGLADKKAVAKMVRMILKNPDLKVIDDVSDAIGIALVASQAQKWQ